MYQVIGHMDNSFGVGVAAERLERLLVEVSQVMSGQLEEVRNSHLGGDFKQHVIAANPDTTMAFYDHSLGADRISGFWAWELSEIPSYFKHTAALLDEVWAVSSFTQKALLSGGIVAKTIKLPVPIPDLPSFKPKSEMFSVLISFDFASDWRRKNPADGIRAYKKAFPTQGDTRLVVKSKNSAKFKREMSVLQNLALGRSDITFISKSLDAFDYQKLLRESSVFLSLHRSEGYGLNIVDSMARGLPVIATGYSGNLDFMNNTNSILVPFDLTPVNFYAGLPIKSSWAQPDINFAANALRSMYEDRNLARDIGMAGRQHVISNHSLSASVMSFIEDLKN